MTDEKTRRSLITKLQVAEKDIASVQGPFVLFALAEREEAPGKWDLLVSAPWLASGRKGIQKMVEGLKTHLTPSEWMQLASITPLPPSMNYVQWIARKYDVQHDNQEIINTFWDGLFIPHGYVITANPAPAQAMPQPVTA